MRYLTTWEHVFRTGFAPQFTDHHLHLLRQALRYDDQRLCQGQTTDPPPLMPIANQICERACALGYCSLLAGVEQGGQQRPATVSEIEGEFVEYVWDCDQRLGEPAASRYFLNWFDETPRAEMRRELGRCLDDILAERRAGRERYQPLAHRLAA